MKPQASTGNTMRVHSSDASSTGGTAEEHSTSDAADWQEHIKAEPYLSCLAEIDKVITAIHSKSAANKIRHGGPYRAVRRVVLAQGNGENVDEKWLKNAEKNLWYTYSEDPFPGGTSSTVASPSASDLFGHQIVTTRETPEDTHKDDDRADGATQEYVSSSDSDTGGAKLDIDWDVYKTTYIKIKDDHNSAFGTSPISDTAFSLSSTGESDKENAKGGTKKGDQGRQSVDMSSRINGAVPEIAKRVTFNRSKPMSLGKFFQGDTKVHKGTERSEGGSTRKATRNTSYVRYADMNTSSTHHVKVSDSNPHQLSAISESRATVRNPSKHNHHPNRSSPPRSHSLKAGLYGQLDGIDDGKYSGSHERVHSGSEQLRGNQVHLQSRRRGSRRASILLHSPSQDNGWIEFGQPGGTYTSPPAIKTVSSIAPLNNAEKDRKRDAALKAWASFPAKAAKEDQEAAAAYEAPKILGLVTSTMATAPVIKETYKKVVVSDMFERKVVEKSVNVIE